MIPLSSFFQQGFYFQIYLGTDKRSWLEEHQTRGGSKGLCVIRQSWWIRPNQTFLFFKIFSKFLGTQSCNPRKIIWINPRKIIWIKSLNMLAKYTKNVFYGGPLKIQDDHFNGKSKNFELIFPELVFWVFW